MNVLKLIANEGFITVNKELIKAFGLHEAILLGSLCSKQEYWNNRAECTPDGYFFCTAEQFEDETTLSPHQQRKAFKTLEEAGVIKTKVTGIPARKYFKVVNSKLLNFLTTRSEEISQLDTEELNSNNNKDNNNKSNDHKDMESTSTKKETKHKYGEYSNVLLSDTDLDKLKNEFPNDYLARIDSLSRYMESTGKTYKNHLATIRNWARNDFSKKQNTKLLTMSDDTPRVYNVKPEVDYSKTF